MAIGIKRVYAAPQRDDGIRILVDRLWPRGLSKNTARIDEWLKDVAPSDQLRKWFGHDPSRWGEFRKRYLSELKTRQQSLRELVRRAKQKRLTLLFGASDEKHNNAVVLREYLKRLGAA